MNSQKYQIRVVSVIAIISIAVYFYINLSYPYDTMDRTEGFYNCAMLVKAILFGSNIIAAAIVLSSRQKND